LCSIFTLANSLLEPLSGDVTNRDQKTGNDKESAAKLKPLEELYNKLFHARDKLRANA
jgi:hypothetical protein